MILMQVMSVNKLQLIFDEEHLTDYGSMHSFIKSAIIFGRPGKIPYMSAIQIWELFGCAVTAIGLPLVISVFIFERCNEEKAKIPGSRTICKNWLQAIRLRKTNMERVPC